MELALIGVVALVVIGPERLPGVARNVGKWIGSARRFVSSVQADINLEVNKAETLKRLLEEQTDIKAMHEILEQTPADLVSRKPVPRAMPADKKMAGQDALNDAPSAEQSERKPEYLVKAINDTPAVEESGVASGGSQDSTSSSTSSSTSNIASSSKHD